MTLGAPKWVLKKSCILLMTSWHGDTFHATDLLGGDSSSHWCFHSQGTVVLRFNICFVKLKKLFNQQSRYWRFQMPWHFLAATKQLYKWYFLSVSLSLCPSVTPFWLCCHHRIIMKSSGVITNDQTKVHAKGQGQRSKVKVTTQLNRFRTVTQVWIHIWWWNNAYSLMLFKRGALLFFTVKLQGLTALKIIQFDPDWAFPTVTQVWIHQWSRNDTQS